MQSKLITSRNEDHYVMALLNNSLIRYYLIYLEISLHTHTHDI